MKSLLVTYFPNSNYVEEDLEVLTIHPQRTLVEKILLLHEEYNRDERDKMRTERMSRHYYDLFHLGRQDFSSDTMNNEIFINEVIEHRKFYSRLKRFDYTSLIPGSISIVPDNEILHALKNDYEVMRSEMIYGNAPTFEEIMLAAKLLEDKFNGKE
jgi:hypothetical protein